MFSAFMLDPVHGWIVTHRLPLDSAIYYCKMYRKQRFNCPVALVPASEDPMPHMMLAEARARRAVSKRIDHFVSREAIADLEPDALVLLLHDLCQEEDGLLVRPCPNPTKLAY